MASIIRVKRSTGTVAPPTINYGELGLTIGVGTHGNGGGRLYAGDNNTPSSNPQVIGGRYYTDILSIEPGKVEGQVNPTTASNGFVAILDQSRKVDIWNVQNIQVGGASSQNTIRTTNANGDIIFDPNGNGQVNIVDDTLLSLGSDKDATIEYDEDSTDKVQVSGADWNYNNGVQVNIADVTESTSTSTGGLTVAGGVGIAKDVNLGQDLNVGGELDVTGIATFHNKVHLLDSDVLHLGGAEDAAGDLQISHSGAHSYIKDAGTGDLRITGSKVDIRNVADNASMIEANDGGDVKLFFNGTQRLRTTNDGVIVTGILTATNGIVIGTPGGPGAGSTFHNGITVFQGAHIDNIGIATNLIKTTSGNTLYIDPYPDGLSNEGTVVIKGDLQVDGTTTTVNSTAVSVNEAIFELSDVTSKRTVLTAANAGATTIVLDSVVGINTGDTIGGTSALTPGGGGLTTAITGYNAGAKTVTIASGTSAGIATNTQLTITHAYDTNTDKGISFNYNTGVGTANNKKGFFGYLDTAPTSTSDAPANSWTYIPDATIAADKVSGTRGFLDVKGIYYQGTTSGAGDWYSSGAAYFDANGKLTSTVNPAGGITTSNYVMTTNASGIPTWTTTLDGGTF